jgi:hypothetical protein
MSFDLKEDRRGFIWKAATADRDDHGFQYAILRYASYVMENNSKKILMLVFVFNNPNINVSDGKRFSCDGESAVHLLPGIRVMAAGSFR